VLVQLMHGARRWIETNPLMPVYKGRDGRRSGIIAIPKEEVKGSRPIGLEGSVCTGLGSRRAASNGAGSSMCVHKSKESKRRWFRNCHCQNQGGMCYRRNLTGPKDGPRATWAEGSHRNSLQIGF
jgi:hypothetical protein